MSNEVEVQKNEDLEIEEELREVNGISDELIVDHAYLVARGVRLLAVIGSIRNTKMATDIMYQRLARVAAESAGTQELFPIPLILGGDGGEWATVGYASHRWVKDAYEWLLGDDVSEFIVNSFVGLLHGYSGGAISRFGRNTSGWRASRTT